MDVVVESLAIRSDVQESTYPLRWFFWFQWCWDEFLDSGLG
jgi:hypothetical protein